MLSLLSISASPATAQETSGQQAATRKAATRETGTRETGTQEMDSKPNIVIILADDLGYGDPRCYNSGSKVPTPHIDALARQGVRFTDAHTPSSVCSPTRYGLLTGRYAWRTSLKRSVLWPYDPPLIEKDRVTLPGMLRTLGYGTTCIGKWHLGWDWPRYKGAARLPMPGRGQQGRKQRQKIGLTIDFSKPIPGGPITRGFDSYFGDDVPNHPPFCFIQDDRCVQQPNVMRGPKRYGWPGPAVKGWDFSAVMPALTAKAQQCIKAQQWIRTHAKFTLARPFFLYFALTAPHTPIAPAKAFLGKSQAGAYGDYVYEVDWAVGQVMQTLAETGLDKNTILVFTSDNGSPARDGTLMSGAVSSVTKKYGHDPNHPWRGVKADIWEAGHRVPFVVRWPGRLAAHTTNDALICLTDLYATFAHLLHVDLEDDQAEDSFDFLPALLPPSPSAATTRPTWQRPHIIHHSLNGTFAIRKGPWKLVVENLGSGGFSKPAMQRPGPDDPKGQLYNLDEDPTERHNLYKSHPAIVSELRALLSHCRQSPSTRLLR